MSEIKPPDDSLLSYFDELLGVDTGDNTQINLPLAVGDNFTSTNVVNLNSRNKAIAIEKKTITAEKKAITTENKAIPAAQKTHIKPLPDYVEPVADKAGEEQKQKLEKLLQTAQQQLLKQETKVEPQTQVDEKIQSRYVQVPDEIQDWPIDIPAVTETIVEVELEVVESDGLDQAVDDQLVSEVANLEWAANGLPQWAQDRFDVLLFNVAGLTLAVPLISLGQIYPLTDELTPLFGQADWFMGLQPTAMGKIRTVNTARFVMPEKYTDSCLDNAKYVMSLDGVPWGLALDSVNQPMRLDPDQVKWRGDRSKRPWLAGIIKDHMCALLDVPRIAQILLDADKNHKRRL